ncbi:hypothetical protein, partial [Rhodonellum psychrophilum]|uniref:hypothetical protein n=1 Tax=Rhodonellum psychrophilum TaxID=336828 RepID=UPI001F33D6A2
MEIQPVEGCAESIDHLIQHIANGQNQIHSLQECRPCNDLQFLGFVWVFGICLGFLGFVWVFELFDARFWEENKNFRKQPLLALAKNLRDSIIFFSQRQ